jgi:hypothetical protein
VLQETGLQGTPGFSAFWKKMAGGRIAITHRSPRDVRDGRWSTGARMPRLTVERDARSVEPEEAAEIAELAAAIDDAAGGDIAA